MDMFGTMKNPSRLNFLAVLCMAAVLSVIMSGCFPNNQEDELCSNSCQYANDGECDDGGPNSQYSLCDCGTDCNDCGERSQIDCLGGSSSSSSGGSSSSSSSGGSSSSGSSSSGSSGSSSSGGPTYMPKGRVTLTWYQDFTQNRYKGTVRRLEGNVEAPWYYPAGVQTYNYTSCSLGIPGGNHNYLAVVYMDYDLEQCSGGETWYGSDSWMPSYEGEMITIQIGTP